MAVLQRILDESRSSLMDLLSLVWSRFRRVGALKRSDKKFIFNLTHNSSNLISGEQKLLRLCNHGFGERQLCQWSTRIKRQLLRWLGWGRHTGDLLSSAVDSRRCAREESQCVATLQKLYNWLLRLVLYSSLF